MTNLNDFGEQILFPIASESYIGSKENLGISLITYTVL